MLPERERFPTSSERTVNKPGVTCTGEVGGGGVTNSNAARGVVRRSVQHTGYAKCVRRDRGILLPGTTTHCRSYTVHDPPCMHGFCNTRHIFTAKLSTARTGCCEAASVTGAKSRYLLHTRPPSHQTTHVQISMCKSAQSSSSPRRRHDLHNTRSTRITCCPDAAR